ncbi:MAG: FtsX-like permease family protein [Vicinamibacterales bacterium]
MATVSTVFGGLALTLAAVGLYGLLAYWVANRTRELGVRLALGASRARIVRLVLKDAAWMLPAGMGAVAIRVVTALWVERERRDNHRWLGSTTDSNRSAREPSTCATGDGGRPTSGAAVGLSLASVRPFDQSACNRATQLWTQRSPNPE